METERLILRLWDEDDVNDLYKLACDEHVGYDCGWKPHKDINESEYVLKNILLKEKAFAIVLKETNQIIGNISVFDSEYSENENQKEIGFWLGYPYWNKGYMSEACNAIIDYCLKELKLEKIWCGYFDYNMRSKSVQEKCGFTFHHVNYHHYLDQLDKTVVCIVNCIENKTCQF